MDSELKDNLGCIGGVSIVLFIWAVLPEGFLDTILNNRILPSILLVIIAIGIMGIIKAMASYKPPVSRKDSLTASIAKHKKAIEKYIDTNGHFKETYKVDNSEYLSHHLVELFSSQDELTLENKRKWHTSYGPFEKREDHEYRRKMIAKIIKERGLKGFAFSAGLYKGQAFNIYYGIGECEISFCHNQVTENWHSLCYSCFRKENYRNYNNY